MWGKSKIFGQAVRLLLLLVLFLLCVSPPCFAAPADDTPLPAEETVTMSIEQWKQLKQIISEQSELLETLETLSTEDSESLKKLLTELTSAKQSLKKAQCELTAAKQSLKIADETLAKQNESLKQLSEEIKRERKVHERQKWQHTIWSLIIGVAIGTVAH